jgi:amino acid transporter
MINILLTYIIPILVLIGLAVTLGYLSNAHLNMKVDPNDPNEIKAYDWIEFGITMGWFIFGIILVIVVIRVLRRKKYNKSKGAAFIVCVLFFILGIIAAVAANNIKKGTNYEENKPYYNDCKGIAIVFVGLGGILFIYGMYKLFSKSDDEKIAESVDNINKQKQTQKQQISNLEQENAKLRDENAKLKNV